MSNQNEAWYQRVLRDQYARPIAKTLVRHLLRHELSQRQLGERIGCDHSLVSKVITGTRNFGPDTIPALARELEMSQEDVALLITGFDPNEYRQRIADEMLPPKPLMRFFVLYKDSIERHWEHDAWHAYSFGTQAEAEEFVADLNSPTSAWSDDSVTILPIQEVEVSPSILAMIMTKEAPF